MMIFTLLMTLRRKNYSKLSAIIRTPLFGKKFRKLSKIFCNNRSAYRQINTVTYFLGFTIIVIILIIIYIFIVLNFSLKCIDFNSHHWGREWCRGTEVRQLWKTSTEITAREEGGVQKVSCRGILWKENWKYLMYISIWHYLIITVWTLHHSVW